MEVRAWIADRLSQLEVRPARTADLSFKLGAGESEAIALALDLRANILLLDDRKARRGARKRGLTIAGTLAVLATAARRGLVDLPAAVAQHAEALVRQASAHS